MVLASIKKRFYQQGGEMSDLIVEIGVALILIWSVAEIVCFIVEED